MRKSEQQLSKHNKTKKDYQINKKYIYGIIL